MSTHVYSADQVDQYLAYIGLGSRPDGHVDDRLGLLTELVKRHRARVPFECLDLHYTPAQRLSLDPEDLFRKVVGRRRGGYCMEVNTFFGAVLRALGFTVTSVGGRVRLPTGEYGGFSHMVNLVMIDGTRYLVDVGFGAYGPTGPLGLVSGAEQPAFREYKMRLTFKALERHTDAAQRVWVYAHTMDAKRAAPGADGWVDAYAFTETEMFPSDYDVLNLWTMTSPRSLFVRSVVAQIMVLDEATGETAGLVTLLDGSLRVRIHGGDITETLACEDERARALAKYFGVRLTDEERQAIRGRTTELKA